VFAMHDPNPAVTGSGAEFLKQLGVRVTADVCQEQTQKLNEAFVKYVVSERPFVIAKCAATLDGRIATRTGDSKWVTGEEARRFVHRLRHAVDAILVGVNTVRTDNPSLTTRLPGGPGKDPVRIILDTHLSIPPDAGLLRQASDSDTILVAGEAVGADKKAALEHPGVRVLESALKNGMIDMHALMQQLGAMKITSVLIEGGSRVLASAFAAGIVDKIFFFYAPKILGGDDGVPICRGRGAEVMRESIAVANIEVHRFGDDVLIEGYIR
jgi:diaminohydroxyphosphoribosylaminopyrimidine deaminase/5-amino-6-(5-phosphoribosylamino)uracil reductase